jgi:ATP-dependent DNA helicase RecG
MEAFFPARVESVAFPPGRMTVRVEDETGSLELAFFRGVSFLRQHFRSGRLLALAGTVTFFRELQLVHPEWEELEEGAEPKGGLLPVYPLTEAMEEARIEHRMLQRAALEALDRFAFSDPLASTEREKLALRPENTLLRNLHAPEAPMDIDAARKELKIRELWPLCLQMESARQSRKHKGKSFPESALESSLLAVLPFALTPGQCEASIQILAGLERPEQFAGLLQGDVGSGKTAVAALAILRVLGGGSQAALLAPTEILAEQHHRSFSTWFETLGVRAALLTASTAPDIRERILAAARSGELGLVIGTHALLSPDLQFRDLRLLVVDEQHRFGVDQRAALTAKGKDPHTLLLSATPIPRTLAHSLFGDLELVNLKDKPPGRLPVKTRLTPGDRESELHAFLIREVEAGNQVYWVVPRIEGGESDAAAVEGALRRLRDSAGDQLRVEAVHGRVSAPERERILADFRSGSLRILVATTVIEVGVDVPSANLMVVEGAERFGLAQLHQLRGRTGRGGGQAWCFLLEPKGGWNEDVRDRLRAFAAIEDGFEIAEMDLRQRGAGDLQGWRQSGFGTLRFTDWIEDADLFRELRVRAQK